MKEGLLKKEGRIVTYHAHNEAGSIWWEWANRNTPDGHYLLPGGPGSDIALFHQRIKLLKKDHSGVEAINLQLRLTDAKYSGSPWD